MATNFYNYGQNIDKLAQNVVQLLSVNDQTITTAESCTGGFVSAAITSVPGSSEVFNLGLCTYANAMKAQMLGVAPQILKDYGAVSEQCAAAMAEGVRKLANATYSIATTGIAGPSGDTPEKPIGTVFIAVSSAKRTVVEKRVFMPDIPDGMSERQAIRFEAVAYALKMAITLIDGE